MRTEHGLGWTGMELAYGRADVALTWLRYTKPRSAVIDYIGLSLQLLLKLPRSG